ncbi:MAG: hypothetical protein GY793_08345 [Proteobacteria bacterium]|nr:hypothetical protein [Pseudomonadota bacterium]
MNLNNHVLEFFIEKTNINKEAIKKISVLVGGSSSNQNFLIELINNKKYQVKFPDERMIGRKSIYAYQKYEASMIKYLNKDGTLIKE